MARNGMQRPTLLVKACTVATLAGAGLLMLGTACSFLKLRRHLGAMGGYTSRSLSKFAWDYGRTSALHMISCETYLAATDLWQWCPRPHRKWWMSQRTKDSIARCLADALLASPRPVVVYVERPYLEEFLDAVGSQSTPRFVLLAVSTDDSPLKAKLQDRIKALAGLQQCFATNLYVAEDPSLFQPLPIGGCPDTMVRHEAVIHKAKREALPWSQRDPRILVTPMADRGMLRKLYLRELRGAQYNDLVHIMERPVDFGTFITLMSKHQSVLSPPGRGYDCYRTWEALAVGTAPVVVDDTSFDDRLLKSAGCTYIPPARQLSPQIVLDIQRRIKDPEKSGHLVQVEHWKSLWESWLA